MTLTELFWLVFIFVMLVCGLSLMKDFIKQCVREVIDEEFEDEDEKED